MGYSSYSVSNAADNRIRHSYHTATVDAIFTQNVKGEAHKLLSPNGLKYREARDSAEHPATVPIILGLDVTGSMGHIPHELIKDGLPTMMGGITQKGLKDATLMFVAIGDHEVDSDPLQVAQFESGDEELDGWLTKTYLEGGGGGNTGESYLLAWLVAAYHTKTDAWEKRGQKGFLFTVGDEPCLSKLPAKVVKELIGDTPQVDYTAADLLRAAQERYNVYHLHILQGSAGKSSASYWKQLLGDNVVLIENYKTVPAKIAEIVTKIKIGTTTPEPVDGNGEDMLLK